MEEQASRLPERFIARRLDQPARPRYAYEYYVTGMGGFPLELLAREQAWPATDDEALKLDVRRSHPARSVCLKSYKPPNIDRWWSYSWKVTAEPAFV